MGDVAVQLRVFPEGVEIDMNSIRSEAAKILEKFPKIKKFNIEEKPVAFGLKMLEIVIVMPDSSGGTDEIENELSAVSGVASVEIGEATLI